MKQTNPWEPALRMYRGMFIVILDIFLLGINTYGWRSSGVNHVLIFEIDPRRHLTHQQLMEVMYHYMGSILYSCPSVCPKCSRNLLNNFNSFNDPISLIYMVPGPSTKCRLSSIRDVILQVEKELSPLIDMKVSPTYCYFWFYHDKPE